MLFRDRQDAGRQLAARVVQARDSFPAHAPPVILGLPRGGVVVAAEVARVLDAPLDVLVVRKIGAPFQPELALGAVTDGEHPFYVLNHEVIDQIGVEQSFLEREIENELAEVRRRQHDFRRGRPAPQVEHHTVIVVDDGIATGATFRAGLAAMRQNQPAHLVLAVPVAASDSLRALADMVDDVICLSTPMNFMSVGRFYANFEQTTDQEVMALLEEAAARMARSA